MNELFVAVLYLICINIISSAVTVSDKKRSIKGRFRIPEKTLFLLAFLGGAFGEYIAMKKIHHKTRHKRFMLGLPLIIIAHIISLCVILVLYFD